VSEPEPDAPARRTESRLPSRRTVSAPFYLALLRVHILDVRGELSLDRVAFRWRPTGWYGRFSNRAPAFEVPLGGVGAVRLHRRRFIRSTLTFEDLAGGEIYADGNTTPIPLEVKAQAAETALRQWGWSQDAITGDPVERWRAPTR
jgi:hypothetical protein